MRYRVTFDRIGRRHDVPPLEAEAATLGELGDRIYDYARPNLASRDVDVLYDPDTRAGVVMVGGMRNAGNFTVEELTA